MKTYEIETSKVPGGSITTVATAKTIREARTLAREYSSRRDLTYQDVRITRCNKLVEYAGPCR